MSDSENLEVLKKRRTIFRTAVTKILNKIETSIASDDVSVEELQEYVEGVTDKFNSLKITDNSIELLVNPDDLEKDLEAAEKYTENVILWKSRANKKIRELNAGLLNFKSKQEVNNEHFSDSVLNDKVSSSVRVKLPKLNIPIFDGNINEWLSFWSSFESAIHDNKSLNKVDKFNYLRSQLRSTALSTIEGFPVSEKNYDAAVELLKTRFGNKQLLIHNHMSNLLAVKPLRNSADIYAFRRYFDKLSVELRSLESLGTEIKQISSVLCTTILKTIPKDLLIELNKSENEKGYYEIEELMNFLSACLKAREKATLVSNSIWEDRKIYTPPDKKNIRPFRANKQKSYPTAHELISTNNKEDSAVLSCVFCESSKHASVNCELAAGLSIEERKNILLKKGACFKCLEIKKHLSRFCKRNIKCLNCYGNHNLLFCYKKLKNENSKEQTEMSDTALFANESLPNTVYLQTLYVYVRNNGFEYVVRALLDTASSKSYISKFVANKMELRSLRKVRITHGLFGGTETTVDHNCYSVNLRGLRERKRIKIEVMEQEKICANVPKIRDINCITELKGKNIFLSDICPESRKCLYEQDSNEIHVLLGADVVGNLFTGKIENLSCGLVAMHTTLGWTTMGKIGGNERDSSLLVLSLYVNDAKITNLWNLDSLGIVDPAEKQSKEEVQKLVLEHFRETVSRETDGRYKVCLPWLNEHPPIPSNKDLAIKRLQNNIKNLNSCGLLKDYEAVLNEWEAEGVIEKVKGGEKLNTKVHYLPHRAVIKPTSTTKIRPVFDGSAHVRGSVSINDCIEKGPNLIEQIPSVLNRFRVGKIGVVADIRRAFLQISLNEKDRDYLRFFWWRDGNSENLEIYRHCRVVFGISCSPFLLAATLTHHLDQAPENIKGVAVKLKESFYVDNCVTSVESLEELEYFRTEAQKHLASAQFDLRGWCYNQCAEFALGNNEKDHLSDENENKIPLLGLMWDTERDTLSCDFRSFKLENESITKRTILSLTHKIFDPIGFTCPVTLIPKLLLQKCWKIKASWDSKLPDEIVKEFKKWTNQIKDLGNLEIPRRLSNVSVNIGKLSLHIFCDASKFSYATCIYLRNEVSNYVTCQLIQARSRVAPLKDISIPRLELLACCIGARLSNSIKNDLKLENVDTFYWSDSMDALYWIKREGPWATFVENRVREIRKLTPTSSWNFVPGHMNPADLPSRGCCAKSLVKSQWWLGPTWLSDSKENWPDTNILPNMDIVNAEKRKTIVTASNVDINEPQFYNRYSSYIKILRVTGWILRFCQNSKRGSADRIFGQLTNNELKKAETIIMKMVQRESFVNVHDEKLKCLRTFTDSEGVIRVKTKIFQREDEFNFRLPVLLPSDHHVVEQLIFSKHLELGHCGVPLLMTMLRENYWVLKSRKTIKKVINKCTVCKRHSSKPPEVEESTLPVDRVRDAAIFEIIGVDLCGPLYLKNQSKVWILIVTCAIFRAVHFELLNAISTDSFILGLTRFISRRGRPSVIYSDNGTNFTGCHNLLKTIDFEKVKNVIVFSRIEWRFIPPSAPWWGGFWERLVGILKRMLRRVLGKSSLNYEELLTVICDCEGIINSRPLTYVTDNNEDLRPITPAMFLQELTEIGMPELEFLDQKKINHRYKYRVKIRNDLKSRFRNEYLGSLKNSSVRGQKARPLCVGDVVLIWTDNPSRIDWPLGKIIELYPSQDGVVRVVKLKTASGILVRPIKKLCPLEVSGSLENRSDAALQDRLTTRRGRIVRPPDRFK